jgi:heptosyltransferase III
MHVASSSPPVVVRFAALGDVVLLTVLLDALAKRHSEPVAVLGSGQWMRALLEHDPAVAEVRLVTSRKAPYWFTPSQREAVAWLRTQRGPIYLCDPDLHSLGLLLRAVPRDRIIRVWDQWPGIDTHWADWWQSVGSDTPLIERSGQPRLTVLPQWRIDAEQWLHSKGLAEHPILLIQAGNKKTAKKWTWQRTTNDKFWPIDRWASVIRGALLHMPLLRVVVCGSPAELQLVNDIVAACNNDRVFPAAADLPLTRLIGLTAIAHSMISIDTGPAHIAAAMDCPSVVLFGHHGWGRWCPRAPSDCVIPLGHRETREKGSVMEITVDEVLNAWKALHVAPLRASGASETASLHVQSASLALQSD